MMNISSRFFSAAVFSATLLFASPVFADADEHIGDAAYQVEEAVKHAGMGHASMVVEPAEKALEHAKAALIEDGENTDIIELVAALEQALAAAKGGNAAKAGTHAKSANEIVKKLEDAE